MKNNQKETNILYRYVCASFFDGGPKTKSKAGITYVFGCQLRIYQVLIYIFCSKLIIVIIGFSLHFRTTQPQFGVPDQANHAGQCTQKIHH